EGTLHHVDVHLHPRMLVTLDGKKNFFARKTLVKGGGLRWLRFVPFAVVFWLGVNVVRGGVAVDDLDLLADHHAEHVRMVFAAAGCAAVSSFLPPHPARRTNPHATGIPRIVTQVFVFILCPLPENGNLTENPIC